MPVILDRLPLPNVSWYTGISILLLLCSVYYAGLQVKKHPDWKEQLQQRQYIANQHHHYAGGYGGLSQSKETVVDVGEVEFHFEGECLVGGEEEEVEEYDVGMKENYGVSRNKVFLDILIDALYGKPCHNYASLKYDKEIDREIILNKEIEPDKTDYIQLHTKKCKETIRNQKFPLKTKYTTNRQNSNKQSPQHSTLNASAEHKQDGKDGQVNQQGNQCSTDELFFDGDLNSQISLYNIYLPMQGQCDNQNERELSPYLIPEIISFMFHEPLCIWTLINMAYCLLILLGTTIQHMVFGELRVSEQQHIKDKFWNFVFYKFIFVFGVMNVKHMDEAVLWCSWFSVLGFLHLLAQLCKDRFEYLSFSGHTGRRTHIRLLCLLGMILILATACLIISVLVGCHAGINTFAFMAAECVLLIVRTLYVITRYSIYLWDITHEGLWEKRGCYVYATELFFELSELVIDMVHHIHMVVWGNIMLTMASLVICMQLRLLFYQLQHKVKTHRNYLRVRMLLARYPEVRNNSNRNNSDSSSSSSESVTCAICWEAVRTGRRLPCGHVFHTDCLLAWLPQHLSCPTCRHKLKPLAQSATPWQDLSTQTIFARLFQRRSSDPLETNNNNGGADNSNNNSNSSSRISSRSNSETNTPQHSPTVAASRVASGVAVEEQLLLVTNVGGADITTTSGGGEGGSSNSKRGDGSSGGGDGAHLHGDDDDGDWLGGGEGGGGGSESEAGGGDGGRYVSWLSSFSVEQRHTQLPLHLHNSHHHHHHHHIHAAATAASTSAPPPPLHIPASTAEDSLHSMVAQVQQLLPHTAYAIILADLRRTRSVLHTIDNILEDRLPSAPATAAAAPTAIITSVASNASTVSTPFSTSTPSTVTTTSASTATVSTPFSTSTPSTITTTSASTTATVSTPFSTSTPSTVTTTSASTATVSTPFSTSTPSIVTTTSASTATPGMPRPNPSKQDIKHDTETASSDLPSQLTDVTVRRGALTGESKLSSAARIAEAHTKQEQEKSTETLKISVPKNSTSLQSRQEDQPQTAEAEQSNEISIKVEVLQQPECVQSIQSTQCKDLQSSQQMTKQSNLSVTQQTIIEHVPTQSNLIQSSSEHIELTQSGRLHTCSVEFDTTSSIERQSELTQSSYDSEAAATASPEHTHTQLHHLEHQQQLQHLQQYEHVQQQKAHQPCLQQMQHKQLHQEQSEHFEQQPQHLQQELQQKHEKQVKDTPEELNRKELQNLKESKSGEQVTLKRNGDHTCMNNFSTPTDCGSDSNTDSNYTVVSDGSNQRIVSINNFTIVTNGSPSTVNSNNSAIVSVGNCSIVRSVNDCSESSAGVISEGSSGLRRRCVQSSEGGDSGGENGSENVLQAANEDGESVLP